MKENIGVKLDELISENERLKEELKEQKDAFDFLINEKDKLESEKNKLFNVIENLSVGVMRLTH